MARIMKRSSKATSSSSLEFFKVFLPGSGYLHMSIPPAFVKRFNGTFPNEAVIKDQMGECWHVTLEKLDDHLYFKNGWQAFVDNHFLKYGDFLIFEYDGRYTFDVRIFGKNGCKKEVEAEAGNSVPILEIEGEPPVEIEDCKPLLSLKRKRLELGSGTVQKSRSISTPNLGKPRNAPKTAKHVVPKGGPCFERTMKRWSTSTLYVCRRVVKEFNILLDANIVLRDEEGKLWPVAMGSTSQNRISFTSGWSKFYKGHKLRVNDKCEFEFVLGKGNVCRKVNVKVTHHSPPALRLNKA